MVRVHPVEFGEISRLPTEELNDLHPRHGLLNMGVDSRDLDSHGAKRFANLESEERCGDREDRNDREGPERELRREHEEHDGKTEHLEDIGDQRDETLGEHLRHVLDVIRRPTGITSKKLMWSRLMWPKMCRRRSRIAF